MARMGAMVVILLKMLLVLANMTVPITTPAIKPVLNTPLEYKVDLAYILRHKVNQPFLPLFVDKNRYNVIKGGASSGKSYSEAEKVIYKMLTEPGHKYLVVRKVAKTIRHSVFALLKDIISDWGVSSLFRWNEGELYMKSMVSYRQKGVSINNEIIFAGLDDVEKLKSIHGITDIWIEEASEISEKDFNQLDLRIRGTSLNKKQIAMTFNPISALHWIKRRFFDVPQKNTTIHHSTYKDNPFLDDDTIEQLKSITDPYFKAVYVHGDWGVFGNVVFTNYVAEDFEWNEDTLENVSNGMDFGYAHASSIIRLGFHEGELYIFDELYGKGWTNPDFISQAEEYFGPEAHDWFVAADSAEPDRIVEFQRAGWVRLREAKKGPGSVRFGIDFLCAYQIHVHATKCPNMLKELQSFKRREDKDGNVMDAFVEINDDCIAAARYASEDLWEGYRGNVPEYGLSDLGL